jgi:nucleoside-diphosphate kinase
MQRTLALVKPDAFAAGHHGAIIGQIEKSGMRIVALKTLRLSMKQAQGFYHVHAARPFFNDLCTFMCEGTIVAMVLEHETSIAKWRDLMGPTNPANADKSTIRGQFGTSIERNASHGSDAPDTAAFEIGYFFAGLELA